MTTTLQKLTEPKTAREQLEGVYEFVMKEPLVIIGGVPHLNDRLRDCSVKMFMDNDTQGYRSFVIRNALRLGLDLDLTDPPYEFKQD